ncbi:MAG TPA: NAD+ synthase [Candidatus Thermoplasmatota archaeon]|nr:NAD+ synthase [Candidatus Thermoplasmatota archaeon]
MPRAPAPSDFDAAEARRTIVSFVAGRLREARAKGIVLGVSGGIDSALVAALCAEAVGPRRVLGLLLPAADSHPRDARDARLVVDRLGIRSESVSIEGVLAAAREACGHRLNDRARANLKARARMLLLYQHANALSFVVAGTGNKSEILTGYFTKFGDGAGDLHPIGDLYKTQVRGLARAMDLPKPVLAKPPTAGLWAGQTDEKEMGIRYAELDAVLACIEDGLSREQARARTGLSAAKVDKVHRMVEQSQHKRAGLIVPKIGFRTPGLDWRVPPSRGA